MKQFIIIQKRLIDLNKSKISIEALKEIALRYLTEEEYIEIFE